MLTERRRRRPAQDLLHDAVDEGHGRPVLKGREARPVRDRVDFLLRAPLGLGVQHHREDKREHRASRLSGVPSVHL